VLGIAINIVALNILNLKKIETNEIHLEIKTISNIVLRFFCYLQAHQHFSIEKYISNSMLHQQILYLSPHSRNYHHLDC